MAALRHICALALDGVEAIGIRMWQSAEAVLFVMVLAFIVYSLDRVSAWIEGL